MLHMYKYISSYSSIEKKASLSSFFQKFLGKYDGIFPVLLDQYWFKIRSTC